MLDPAERRRRQTRGMQELRADRKRRAAAIAAFDTIKPTFCDAADVEAIFRDASRLPAHSNGASKIT